MEPIETLEYNGKRVEIYQDEDAQSPRKEFDNASVMVCFHKRYCLGDKDHGYNFNDYGSWGELEDAIIKDHKPTVILPLYLYDHSGITIATSPFSCPWDSGQIGYVFFIPKAVRDCYGVKKITKAIKEKAEKLVQGEVEGYNMYLTGEVYGYITKDENGNDLDDSCWGIFGYKYVMEEANSIIERWKKEELKPKPIQDVEGQEVMQLV